MTKVKENKELVFTSVPATFTEFKQTKNPSIVQAECRVAYQGENRNGSFISKESFQKAMDSIEHIPLVGNWLGDNFGGHDIILETKGNEMIFKNNTEAFGVVPDKANAQPRWETIYNEFGVPVEYLVVNVFLWLERYEEQIKFIASNNGVGQSMEIGVTEGYWDENDLFVIEDFYYSALCLLGKSDDKSKHVEPCFEDAGVNFSIASQVKEFRQVIEGSGDIVSKTVIMGLNSDVNEEPIVEEPVVAEEPTVEPTVTENSIKEPAVVTENHTEGEATEEPVVEDGEKTENKEPEVEENDNEDGEVEELKAQLKALKTENQSLKDSINKKEVAEVVDAYSKLMSIDEINAIMAGEEFSAKELKAELAIKYSELQIATAQKDETSTVIVKADSEFSVKPEPVANKFYI